MIKNSIYKTMKDIQLPNGISFMNGQEVIIVMDVVYVNGFMLDTRYQISTYNFIIKNLEIFTIK